MSNTCLTVKVKNPAEDGGYMIINESDLTSEHELFDVPAAEPAADDASAKRPRNKPAE